MPDWTSSMQQTFEYYEVDPWSWKDKRHIDKVTGCTISRDLTAESLGSSTIDSPEEFGEIYVRVYLVTIQNGVTERTCLGTFLVQTPNDSFDGKVHTHSYDAYTPLIELKGNYPPLGYYVEKDVNTMERVYSLCRENMRPPVIEAYSDHTVFNDFVTGGDETWLSYLSDLMANAKFQFALDETSRVIFEPIKDIASLQPVWTYDDGNSSILYPDISNQRDLYGIPNVVEVIYTNGNTNVPKVVTIENNDTNSPISIPSRGRKVLYRESNPSFSGEPTDEELHTYAVNLLRNLSTLEYTISYQHGYCPVRIGDCVLLNYERAGFHNIKARVVSQSISCESGCPVNETATYTVNMWEG